MLYLVYAPFSVCLMQFTGDGEDESISEVKIPKRNPKMYQLVAMESESSFWWDSVDSTVNLNDDREQRGDDDQKFVETDDDDAGALLRAVRL